MQRLLRAAVVALFAHASAVVGVHRPNMITCFVNWQGPCQSMTASIDVSHVLTYIDQVNAKLSSCNMNPDRTRVPGYLVNDGAIDSVVYLPCVNTVRQVNMSSPTAPFRLPYNVTKVTDIAAMYTAESACKIASGGKDAVARANPPYTTVLFNVQNLPEYGAATEGDARSTELMVWVRADRVLPQPPRGGYATTLTHELGHTWGLEHSHSRAWDLGDCSCPMGCADTIDTCFNAPNARKLGWAAPLLPPQVPGASATTYVIPVFTTAYENHVVLDVSGGYALYLSVRSSQGSPFAAAAVAAQLVSNYNGTMVAVQNAVSVHLVSATDTYFVDAVAEGATLSLRPVLSGMFGLNATADPTNVVVVHARYDPVALQSTVVVHAGLCTCA